MPEATLVHVQMEVSHSRLRPSLLLGRMWYQPGYRWVNGFKVIDPQGREIQPYMRIREAYAYCKEQGWSFRVQS